MEENLGEYKTYPICLLDRQKDTMTKMIFVNIEFCFIYTYASQIQAVVTKWQ